MGALNDKMTALADKIREKHIVYPYKMNIDKMIELVDELHLWQQYFEGSAQPGDVSAGHTFYSDSFDLQTGTMPDTAASVEKNIVTVPAGRIRKEQVITIPAGSVTVDGATITTTEGYVESGTLTVPSGSVSINGNKVDISAGYVEDDTLTVPAGNVAISDDNSKVIVTEGYVMDDEIDLPGGSSLFRCAAVYGPKRVSGFIVSGAGTSAVNGNYLPTDLRTEEDTPIYKHETAEYYYFEMWGEKGICTSPTDYPGNGLYYNMYDEGWYPGSGGAEPAPTVTAGSITLNADVPKTWDGYKIEKSSDGAFSVASALTTGLPYAHITPAVGNVYTQDGLVKADYIRMFRSGELLIIPLVSNEWKADTGQTLTIKGGDRVRPDCGCTAFLHNTSENYVSAPLSVGSSPRTFTVWLKSDGRACSIFSIWSGDISLDFGQASDGNMRAEPNGSSDNQQIIDGTFVDQGVWRHYAIVLSSGKFKAYLNGEYVGETDLPSSSVGMEYTSCRVPATKNPLANNTHYVRDFRVYSRELSAAEILAIFNENNPVK